MRIGAVITELPAKGGKHEPREHSDKETKPSSS